MWKFNNFNTLKQNGKIIVTRYKTHVSVHYKCKIRRIVILLIINWEKKLFQQRNNFSLLNKRLSKKKKFPVLICIYFFFLFLSSFLRENSSGLHYEFIYSHRAKRLPQCPVVWVLAAPEQQWKDVCQVSSSWFLVHWAGVEINGRLLGFCGAAHCIHMHNRQWREENLPNNIIHISWICKQRQSYMTD